MARFEIPRHEPIRIPNGCPEWFRTVVIQLERIHDDIYKRFRKWRKQDLDDELAGEIDGVSAKVSGLGTITTGTEAESLVVPDSTYTTICTMQLPKGKYIISAGNRFTASFSELAIGRITDAGTGINGTLVRGTGASGGGYSATTILELTEAHTIGLSVYQASGSDKTASYISLKAIRIE